MIIQGSKADVSIPKEWLSFYNTDTQTRNAIPTFWAKPYIHDDGVDTVTWEITSDAYYISDELSKNKYGWIYGIKSLYDVAIYNSTIIKIFGNDIVEFKGEPSIQDYFNERYYDLQTSTDSSTGVQKKIYYSTLLVRTAYSTSGILAFNHEILKFNNSNIVFSADLPTSVNIYFNFPSGSSYSSTILDHTPQGASKSAKTYNFYLDNTSLKDALAAKADQYTTINLYHLDETPWS